MKTFKFTMLTSTVIPVAVALGVGVTGIALTGASFVVGQAKAQCSPCAAKNPCNPCAAKNPCNPCAAKNPCNPCAAANPCNPCAGAPVAAGLSNRCVVPRLATASLCNPCAPKNPCNPCAATNPCNPCAAKNPCNPCAAANPCNPCAAANPCNPCNPCAAGGDVALSIQEAAKAYDCIVGQLRVAYAKSGDSVAAGYQGWRRYSKVAYASATHGGRYVQNYANNAGRRYGLFERAGVMPVGAIIAKDSFGVSAKGQVSAGPLFVMEKMTAGFNQPSGDWKYTMIMPTGAVFGATRGKNSAGMKFCAECHALVGEEQDHMMLLPEEYRSGG